MAAVDYALRGKTVLITGAGGGIGRALSQAFAAQGASLWLLDRAPSVMQLAEQLGAQGLCLDLGSDDEVAAFAQRLKTEGRQVDVLLNNAGTEFPTPLSDSAPDANARWAALLDNNVVSMLRLIRALLPLMPAGASVINQASIWGKTGVADFSAYVASKHAVIGLTRSLAFELAPQGVRVNAVCPGWIATDAALRSLSSMARSQCRSEAEVEAEILSRQATPKMLTPPDIVGIYLFLACADAAALTGQSIVVSHGEVMN